MLHKRACSPLTIPKFSIERRTGRNEKITNGKCNKSIRSCRCFRALNLQSLTISISFRTVQPMHVHSSNLCAYVIIFVLRAMWALHFTLVSAPSNDRSLIITHWFRWHCSYPCAHSKRSSLLIFLVLLKKPATGDCFWSFMVMKRLFIVN